MVAWVTADEIRAQAGNLAPDPADTWAIVCADAVSSGIDARMEGVTVADPADFPELQWSALTAGVEAYKRKEAVFGLTGFADLQGAAIRISRDYLEAVAPQIARYATRGIV